jgi:hypothetical protein
VIVGQVGVGQVGVGEVTRIHLSDIHRTQNAFYSHIFEEKFYFLNKI